MAVKGAHKRSSFLIGAVALALLCALLGAPAVLGAANPGGASAPSNSGGGVAPVATKPAIVKHGKVATPHGVRIAEVRCVPVNNCSGNLRQVSVRGRLVILGSGLKSGMPVAFPRAGGAKINSRSPTAHLHKSSFGMVVAIPSSAHSGHIVVLLSHGKRSNSYGPVYVVRHALHPPAPKHPTSLASAGGGVAGATAFDAQGMWIWYVGQSSGGSVPAIIAQAHAAGVGTVFVKSSDGSSNYWSQFSAQLVAELHAAGLKVCAWQYVYGTNPTGEANLGAQAVATGADCLVIDAEAEYEKRYSSAQTYITDLRAKIGLTYPLGLASFPYVDYHESFPYSVFMGPGGAQFNLPQMYWKAIGTSVDAAFAHTYLHNRIYARAIYPLGQTYEHPSSAELLRFRELSSAYGASGLSFWDWQETAAEGWAALTAPLAPAEGVTVEQGEPLLGKGSKGDEVLWMQEHLASAIATQQTTGNFAAETETNLRSFQASHALPASGQTDPATWQALLALPPVAVDWTGGGPEAR